VGLATLLCFHFVVSLERDGLLGREVDVTVDTRIREIRSIEDITGLEKGDRVFYGLDIDIEYWGDLLVGFGAPASTADFNVSERLSAATDEHYYGIYMYPNSSYWILPNHLYHKSYSNNPRPGNSEITRFNLGISIQVISETKSLILSETTSLSPPTTSLSTARKVHRQI
jgi:hypothetical protein